MKVEADRPHTAPRKTKNQRKKAAERRSKSLDTAPRKTKNQRKKAAERRSKSLDTAPRKTKNQRKKAAERRSKSLDTAPRKTKNQRKKAAERRSKSLDRPHTAPRKTKNQRKKAAKRRSKSLADVEIKTEAQFQPKNAKSGPFDMNPSFPLPGTPRYWTRTDLSDQRLAHLNNDANRYRHPQPSGPSAINPKYLWNYSPPPPRPPTPALANGRGRKRSVDADASYDLKRQRLASPGPGPAPFAAQISPRVPWAAQDGAARPAQPNPQTPPPPSLWGDSSTSGSQLQPYTKDKLSGQIVDLYEACQQQASDLERKELCRTQLQKEIQKVFPAARIYLAGSSLNGFGSSSSDADLCLVLPRASVSVLWTDTIVVLTEIYQLFRQLAYLRNVQLIRAKVPILKARDSVSGVEFDLNVNNTVGIRNTFLLRTYAYLEPRVRPLVLVVKKWAQHYDINDASKGTLSSYTLVLMVLHYLQTLQSPVVPSLQNKYPECFSVSMDIHMVPEGPRHIPAYSSSNRASLGDLLLGFLKHYGCSYRWDQSVVSVREGKTLPKNTNYEWKNKFICVEEPFEKKNTARAVHEKAKFDTIKTRFTESWRALQQSKDLNSILPVRKFTSLGR